jgi:hypothetical protein
MLNDGILKALRQALRILGYDGVHHGYSVSLENPRDCEMGFLVYAQNMTALGRRLGGWNSTSY